MSDTSNQSTTPNASASSADPQAKSEPQTGKGLFDSASSAFREGAEDAKRAAKEAIPKLKSAAADAVYWAGYGVAYAAVFQWTVAKQLTPESLKAGWRDGVKAGRTAAENWMDNLKQRKVDPTADPSAAAGGPGQQTQPSAL